MTYILDPDKGITGRGKESVDWKDCVPDRCPDCGRYPRKTIAFIPGVVLCWDSSGRRHKPAGRAAVACWGCVHARCEECLVEESQ